MGRPEGEDMIDSGRGSGGTAWSVVVVVAVALSLAATPIQAQIPQVDRGACGPMDVVFVVDTTGSMGGAISNIIADSTTIIDTILIASDDDAQLGLVVVNGLAPHGSSQGDVEFDGQVYDCFIEGGGLDPSQYPGGFVGDCIIVLQDLAMANAPAVLSSIGDLDAGDGGFTPEITAEALRTILQGVDQTSDVTGGPSPEATAPAAPSGNPNDWPRLQWNDWDGAFRGDAKRIVFLLTDNVPGGTDSQFNFVGTEDSDQAAAMAAAYAAAFGGDGIIIQPVQVAVTNLCIGGLSNGLEVPFSVSEADCITDGGAVGEGQLPSATTIMQAYADATGGTLTQVPNSGEGTALSIISIIENCGEVEEEKEGRMTGGGSIFNEDDRSNGRTTHGFTLHCDGGPNRLQVNWRGYRFHLEELEDAVCTDNPELDEENPVSGFDTMTGTGYGRLNGVSGAKVEFEFTDDGEPGKGVDTAKITITPAGGGSPVLDTFGTLQRGNHQAHPEN